MEKEFRLFDKVKKEVEIVRDLNIVLKNSNLHSNYKLVLFRSRHRHMKNIRKSIKKLNKLLNEHS